MSLKEVRLIRMLIWILLYLVILFLLIFTVVIPSVKEYKRINKKYVQSRAEFMAAEQEYNEISDRLKSLHGRHRKVIEAFENRWDEKVFVKSARKYFQKIGLKLIDVNQTDSHYKIYEINAYTRMESPQNFYRFLDSLSSSPFVVQADFPIAFKANGEEIEGIFRIRVFEEKRLKSQQSRSENNSSEISFSKM